MSIRATNWARHQVRADGPSAQAIIFVIADCSDPSGLCQHADPDTLAEETRQSRATVFRRLDELERAGAIERTTIYGARGQRRYQVQCRLDRQINYESVEELPAAGKSPSHASPEDGDGDADQEMNRADRESQIETHPPPPHESQFETHSSLESDQPRVSPVRLSESHSCDSHIGIQEKSEGLSPNPSQPKSEPPKEASGSAKAAEARTASPSLPPEPALFASMFSRYPQHQLDNRPRAAQEFAKLADSDRVLADRVVDFYARDIAKAKRRPKACWKWLRDRGFAEFGPGSSVSPERTFIADGTDPATAWKRAFRLAYGGEEARWPYHLATVAPTGERGANVPTAGLAPGGLFPIGGTHWLTPLEDWLFVEWPTPQARRWAERIQAIAGRMPPMVRAGRFRRDGLRERRLIGVDGKGWDDARSGDLTGLLVPSEWPPAKHPRDGPPTDDVASLADEMDGK